tara:strand:- start:165 stop:530 length:366 start_codon:yes stop_codon:yes gene_type:complete
MSLVSDILSCYTTPQLCKAFKCSPEELFYQAERGPDGLTRFERNFNAARHAAFEAYGDTLYDQAWADNRTWDELERKAKGYLVEMLDWSEAEKEDERMQHYYEALERRMKPSRAKRWHARV